MHGKSSRRAFLEHSASAAGAALGLAGLARAIPAAEGRPTGGGLKKGVLWAMLPGKMAVADRFKLAADAGFEGVEAPTTQDEKTVEEMRAAATKAGIPIHSVMNMGHWSHPLSSPDPAVAKSGIELIKISVGNAKAWGADTVLLVPAVVTPETRYQDAYTRSQKVIREQVLPMAREVGVTVCIENVWNKFLLSPLEFARYIDAFKDGHVAAYFDVGNVVQYGYPEDWILTLGPRIRKMHVKDFKRKGNEWKPLREGDVDWPAVRKALADIGYSGFLTAELPGGDEPYLREVARRMDLIIEGK
jgi:L-ribulose-5-phosphate 3-epimerase